MLNSGGANCFTGSFGFQTTHQTAEKAAELLGVSAGDILICSTGLIGTGDEVFRAKVLDGTEQAIGDAHADGGLDAAHAIMTTDSVPKRSRRHGDGWTIGGMAKGAGMLAPGPCDDARRDHDRRRARCARGRRALAARDPRQLRPARLGRLHVDERSGHAHGRAARPASRPDPDEFARPRSTELCPDLAHPAAGRRRGREPRHHDPRSFGAASEADAVEVGRSVARNNLFKAAIFGNDPNWGRVLAAIGTTEAEFDPYDVDVWMNGVRVCSQGGPDAPRDDVDLTPRADRTSTSTSRSATRRRRSSRTTSRTTTYTRTAPTRHDRHRPARHRPRRGERQGRDSHRVAAVAAALQRPDHRDQVRRQRDGQRRAAGRVRRRHRLPPLRRGQARRRARRRSADLVDARPPRDPERVQGRLPRHQHRGDQRGAHGADRSDQPAARGEDQRARPARHRV